MELRLCLCPPDGEERHVNETCPERKYVFIWRQNDYLKAAVDEIQWIEAAGSYSRIVPQACGDTGREQAEDRQ